MEAGFKYFWFGIFHIMLWGNILWLIVLNTVGNIINVSWVDIEHVVRPYGFMSFKQMHERNGRDKEYVREFRENIKFFRVF